MPIGYHEREQWHENSNPNYGGGYGPAKPEGQKGKPKKNVNHYGNRYSVGGDYQDSNQATPGQGNPPNIGDRIRLANGDFARYMRHPVSGTNMWFDHDGRGEPIIEFYPK